MKPLRNTACGLSLTEVLIVIGVIVLLLSMVMPAMYTIRRSTWDAACKVKISQYHQASTTYAFDHQGYLPVNTQLGGLRLAGGSVAVNPYYLDNYPTGLLYVYDYWQRLNIATYGSTVFKNDWITFKRDPGDRDFSAANYLTEGSTLPGNDYFQNANLFARTSPPCQYNSMRINAIRNPASAYAWACGCRNLASSPTPQASKKVFGFQYYHGGKKVNVGMADGHVESRLDDGQLNPTSFPSMIDTVNFPETYDFWHP